MPLHQLPHRCSDRIQLRVLTRRATHLRRRPDDDIVSTSRQQTTSSGISPSSTDTYGRMLYDTLLRPITTNRFDSAKYLETKNITELSGLCVHTLTVLRTRRSLVSIHQARVQGRA